MGRDPVSSGNWIWHFQYHDQYMDSFLKIYEVKNNTVYFYVDEKLGENALKFLKRKEFDIFYFPLFARH